MYQLFMVWLVILSLFTTNCNLYPTDPKPKPKEEIVVAPKSIQQVPILKPTIKPTMKREKPIIISATRDSQDENTWHVKVNKIVVEMAKKNHLEVHILAGYVYFNADITGPETIITLGWTPPDSELTVGVYNPDTGKYLVSAFIMEEE